MNTREAATTPAAVPPARNGANHEGAEAQPPARTAGRKRYIGMAIGAIVVIALAIWGVQYLAYARVHETTDDARVDANTVDLTSKISERVDSILVDTNQPVHKGQLLIVLDNADERAKVAQAQANYQLALETQQAQTQQGQGGVTQASASITNAQDQVPEAQAGVDVSLAQLRAAQAQVPGARQALAKAQADLQRTQSLVATGDLPRQQLDAMTAAQAQAQSQYRATLDNVNSAQANVDVARQRVSVMQSGVGMAQGSLQTAQGKLTEAQAPSEVQAQRAALEIAQQNLGYTKIYAPIDGYVGERSVDIGQTVQPGSALMTIIPNNVFVTANYKETQIGDMRPGQSVDIHVDAYKGKTFHGTVLSINPASQNTYALVPAQNSTGNFVKVTQRIPVKIGFGDDANGFAMRPGMSVEASVATH